MKYLVAMELRNPHTYFILQPNGRWCSRGKSDFSLNPLPPWFPMKFFDTKREAEDAMERIGPKVRNNPEDPDNGPLLIVEVPDDAVKCKECGKPL